MSRLAVVICFLLTSTRFAVAQDYYPHGLLPDPTAPQGNEVAPNLRPLDIHGLFLDSDLTSTEAFFAKQKCQVNKTYTSYNAGIYLQTNPIRVGVTIDCVSPSENWHVVVLPPIAGGRVFSISYKFFGNYYFPNLAASVEQKYGVPPKQTDVSTCALGWEYSNLSIVLACGQPGTYFLTLSRTNFEDTISGPLTTWETQQKIKTSPSAPQF